MSLEKRPPGVMLYFAEMQPILSLMSNEERGELLTAIFNYAASDVDPVLSERVRSVWPFVKSKIDHDAEIYRKKCEKAAKSAKSRWKKKGEKG